MKRFKVLGLVAVMLVFGMMALGSGSESSSDKKEIVAEDSNSSDITVDTSDVDTTDSSDTDSSCGNDTGKTEIQKQQDPGWDPVCEERSWSVPEGAAEQVAQTSVFRQYDWELQT